MTQANETNSRIARLEALMLEIAAANLRHDRAIDQHNTDIARYDEEFSRINATLDRVTQQQAATTAGQELNQQAIATLTASIQELRNLVADYIQGRSQNETNIRD